MCCFEFWQVMGNFQFILNLHPHPFQMSFVPRICFQPVQSWGHTSLARAGLLVSWTVWMLQHFDKCSISQSCDWWPRPAISSETARCSVSACAQWLVTCSRSFQLAMFENGHSAFLRQTCAGSCLQNFTVNPCTSEGFCPLLPKKTFGQHPYLVQVCNADFYTFVSTLHSVTGWELGVKWLSWKVHLPCGVHWCPCQHRVLQFTWFDFFRLLFSQAPATDKTSTWLPFCL